MYQHPQVIRSLGKHHGADAPFIHCFAQMVGDADEQDVLRLRAQVIDGIKQVFSVRAESVPPWRRLTNLDPPGGDPHPPGTPPFARMGPAAGYAYESARTICQLASLPTAHGPNRGRNHLNSFTPQATKFSHDVKVRGSLPGDVTT